MDDAESMSAGAPTPARDAPKGEPPGLRAQFGSTFEAGKRLLRAHVDLAKTELGEIVGEVKRMVALAGVAIGAFVMVGLLLTVGLLLFLGEWLFGSIGWGVLLGTLLLIDVAVMALLMALDVKGARVTTTLLIAVATGVVVGLVLGFDVTHRAWQALGDAVLPQFDPASRTTNLAVGSLAVIGAVVGFVARIRSGVQGALVTAIGFAIVGALIGWVTSITIAAQVGAALGVLVALVTWPALAGLDVMRTGVDGEAIAKKFTPEATIEMTKETIEWVRARTPLVPKS